MSDSESEISEDSEYSGLEEEPETSDEEEILKQHKDSLGKSEEISPVTNDKGTVELSKDNGQDEYTYDSSDEEDLRNTVGNIPMEWYKEFEHIGYDLQGKKIVKPETGDELEVFLKKMEDINFWKTVRDGQTGQDVVLSDNVIDAIKKMKRGQFVDKSSNPYAPWVDLFSHEVMKHPLTSHPPQKRSFIPSKWEKMKVGHLVHAMKMGWIKKEESKEEERKEDKFYMLWASENQEERKKRQREHIPAPKQALPGHEESYNPPQEYLFTGEEEKQWKTQESYERKINFIPRKYSSLRLVPAFVNFINERFDRCLDLYLCPRQVKLKMNIDPNDLIPNLPKPKDLQPFPSHQSVLFKGHKGIVRCIAVDPTGQWLISGSDDFSVKFWEVSTARCMNTINIGSVIRDVMWSPTASLSLVAVTSEKEVLIFNSNLGDKLINLKTDDVIASLEKVLSKCDGLEGAGVTWTLSSSSSSAAQLKLSHPKTVAQIAWHSGGDYLAACMPQGENTSVLIHQIPLCRTQSPFKKSKGLVQSVLFHPTRPLLFVATQRYVRIYNLLKQELIKKLFTNSKWVSSMAVHPSGNHLIIGSYDCKLSWFDLDLSEKPYKTLRHHTKAIRQVCYHRKYPLFASAGDDGTVIICHGMVFNDLLQNPVIVPVKILKGHQLTDHLGILDCEFHPTQPWILSSGADETIRLYS